MGRSNINRGMARLEELRERAEERRAEREKRSPTEQIALLDKRFGEGIGAKKERARLLSKLEEERPANRKVKSDSTPDKKIGKGERRKAKARRVEERNRSRQGNNRESS